MCIHIAMREWIVEYMKAVFGMALVELANILHGLLVLFQAFEHPFVSAGSDERISADIKFTSTLLKPSTTYKFHAGAALLPLWILIHAYKNNPKTFI